MRRCDGFEEAISARIDGEVGPPQLAALDAHLATCPSCQAFATRSEALSRRMRVREATAVPDLTDAILAATVDAPTAAGTGLTAAGTGLTAAAAGTGLTPPAAEPLAGRSTGGGSGRHPHRRTAAVAAAVALGAAGLGAALGKLAAHRPTVVATQVAGSSQRSPLYPGSVVLPRAIAKPTVTLTTTSGQPYNLMAATSGRVALLYFGYTHCPDVCPVNLALDADAVGRLPASERSRVAVVFVTTDPARDTPATLRSWLDNFNPAFIGLTGPSATIQEAERQVSMPLSYTASQSGGRYLVVHSGYTLVYSQDGMAQLQVDATDSPGDLATTLARLLAEGYRPR